MNPTTKPRPQKLIGQHMTRIIKLFTVQAACPLYVHVHLIAPGLVGRRASFWLDWIVEPGRWAHRSDWHHLPADVLDWAAVRLKLSYPDLATSAGLTPEAAEQLRAGQLAKRAAHDARRAFATLI